MIKSSTNFNKNPLDAWEGLARNNMQSVAFAEMERIRSGVLTDPKHPQLILINDIEYWQNWQREGFERTQMALRYLEITKDWNLPRWTGLEGHILRHYVGIAIHQINNNQKVKFENSDTNFRSPIPEWFMHSIKMHIERCCKNHNDSLKN